MQPAISVITCTHNPRPHYLERVLTALNHQTLSQAQWEFIFIDNASDRLLASEIDLSWHTNARHIREEQLGLTYARLRGIREARAEVLVFVDDDNVLSQDYLEVALNLSQNWAMLGAWGGQCLSEFETQPPAWAQPYVEYLGIRSFDQDRWSNLAQWETTPIGAGLCVRKAVALTYADFVQNDPNRSKLDRQGSALLGCGDMDLAYTACDVGLGIGIFTALKLAHLMPPQRLEAAYLLKLVEQSVYSRVLLNSLREQVAKLSWKGKLKLMLPPFISPKVWLLDSRERQFRLAIARGHNQAMKALLQQQ